MNLGIGDATRPLFPCVVEKTHECARLLSDEKTFKGYPPVNGYDFFKSAVSRKYARWGVKVSADDVFVSDGAKSDIFALLHVFGKITAMIKNPTYPAYLDANLAFGNEIMFLYSDKANGFLPSPYDLENDKKDVGALIYICSPDNPTGATYDKKGLTEWVKHANRTGSVIVFDGAYSDYVTGNRPRSIFQIDGAEECAIEISSLSKSANFTGVRLGWTIIGERLERKGVKLKKVFSRMKASMTNGVSYLSQYAGAEALSDVGLKRIAENVNYYKENALTLKAFFDEIGVFASGAENSPYVFFECPNKMKSFDCFDFLLNDVGVIATPGSGYNTGGENFMRLSGFCSRNVALKAVERLSTVF